MAAEIQGYNLLTGNKWILSIPFQQINPDLKYEDVCLNLTNFSLPDFTVSQSEFGIRGVSIPIPSKVRNESKSITFNYMLSHDWSQYKLLYKWFSLIVDESGRGTDSSDDPSGGGIPPYLTDITVIMLSEYKNLTWSMVFRGAWISSLGSIDLNYQQGEENIQHSFTINYAYYEINDLLTDDEKDNTDC
jgi:hypothetical protein